MSKSNSKSSTFDIQVQIKSTTAKGLFRKLKGLKHDCTVHEAIKIISHHEGVPEVLFRLAKQHPQSKKFLALPNDQMLRSFGVKNGDTLYIIPSEISEKKRKQILANNVHKHRRINVKCPKNGKAGDTIKINIDGNDAFIVIPENTSPGDYFQTTVSFVALGNEEKKMIDTDESEVPISFFVRLLQNIFRLKRFLVLSCCCYIYSYLYPNSFSSFWLSLDEWSLPSIGLSSKTCAVVAVIVYLMESLVKEGSQVSESEIAAAGVSLIANSIGISDDDLQKTSIVSEQKDILQFVNLRKKIIDQILITRKSFFFNKKKRKDDEDNNNDDVTKFWNDDNHQYASNLLSFWESCELERNGDNNDDCTIYVNPSTFPLWFFPNVKSTNPDTKKKSKIQENPLKGQKEGQWLLRDQFLEEDLRRLLGKTSDDSCLHAKAQLCGFARNCVLSYSENDPSLRCILLFEDNSCKNLIDKSTGRVKKGVNPFSLISNSLILELVNVRSLIVPVDSPLTEKLKKNWGKGNYTCENGHVVGAIIEVNYKYFLDQDLRIGSDGFPTKVRNFLIHWQRNVIMSLEKQMKKIKTKTGKIFPKMKKKIEEVKSGNGRIFQLNAVTQKGTIRALAGLLDSNRSVLEPLYVKQKEEKRAKNGSVEMEMKRSFVFGSARLLNVK
eukprot:g2111.t1